MNFKKLFTFALCSLFVFSGLAKFKTNEVKADLQTTDSTITNIHIRDNGGQTSSSSLYMGFFINNVDYTTNNYPLDKSKISDYNFLNNIKVYTETKCFLLNDIFRNNEVATHSWGDTMINVAISNMDNQVNASTIKFVEINEGTTFPNEARNGAYRIPYTVLKNIGANPNKPGWSINFTVLNNSKLITYKTGADIVGYDFAIVGTQVSLPEISPEPGYEAVWSSNDVTIQNKSFVMPDKNIVIDSVIQKAVYTITYNLNGGTATNPDTYSIDTETFTLNNPTKEGHEFLGWTTSKNKTPVLTYVVNKGSTGNLVLTANFQINTYTFVFDPNNGDQKTSLVVSYGTLIVPEDVLDNPSKEGSTFAGWYVNDEKFDFSNPIKSDVEVKAKWTNFFTVNFVAGEGASQVDELIVEVNTLVPEVVTPTKQNATFEGWYLNGVLFDFDNDLVTSNITLRAKWSENETNDNGCSGSVIVSSGFLSMFSLVGFSLLLTKKKEN